MWNKPCFFRKAVYPDFVAKMKTVLLTILPCQIDILRKGNVQALQIGQLLLPSLSSVPMLPGGKSIA